MRICVTFGVVVGILSTVVMPAQIQAGGWGGLQCTANACPFGATSFYTGYFVDPTRAGITFRNSTPTANSLNELSHQVDLRGVWFELLVPVKCCGPLGVMLGGFYHFPLWRDSNETVNTLGQATVARTWKAAPQWGGTQLALTYELSPSLTGIVGFKYSNFQVNFSNVSPVLNPNDVGDRADISINEYIPYFGFSFSRVLPSSGIDLELGLIGFPTVMGSVEFTETVNSGFVINGTTVPVFLGSANFRSGGFLEWFAELSLPVRDCCRLGAFVRYNVVQASSVVNVGERNNIIPARVDYDFDFDRRVWSVGGSLSFVF